MGRKIICLCNLVEEREIRSALNKGAVSMEEITLFTGAGRSCGRCRPEIGDLMRIHQKKKPKDLQGKLDFGF